MKSNYKMQIMIHNAIADILEATQQIKRPRLLLTKAQYDIDKEFWKKAIKQKGGTEEDIVIVPSTIEEV